MSKIQLSRVKCYYILIITLFLLSPHALTAQTDEENFTHLETLRRNVTLQDGRVLRIWMSVADPGKELSPPLYVVKADVIAKVALLYLSHFEKKGDSQSLKKAKDALDALALMQDERGLFHKSMKDDGSLADKAASNPDLTSAYAFWALSRGYRITKKPDDAYSAKIEKLMEKTVTRLKSIAEEDSEDTAIHGRKVPGWLIGGQSAVTAIFVLGLCEYQAIAPRPDIKELIRKYCDSIASFSGDNNEEFPFCAHFEDGNDLTAWTLANNRQIAALAAAGAQYGNSSWIESAERAVNGLYTHLIASYGPICGMNPGPVIYPQDPASCQVMTENLITLFKATGKKNYAMMAGLAASWLLGDNNKGEILYDREKGRGYYLDAQGIRADSGLESTVDALKILIDIQSSPAYEYLRCREKSAPHTFIVLEAEEGKPVRKDYEIEEGAYRAGSRGKYVVIKKENSFWIKFEIRVENEYDFYLVFREQPGITLGSSIMMRIDGDRIFTVPLGGSPDYAYMAMKEIIEPRLLLPGLHSLGIRFSGLLHSKPAVIDSVVLQPAIEWRIFSRPDGETLIFLKSFHRVRRELRLESLSLKNLSITSWTLYSRMGNIVSQEQNPKVSPSRIEIPEYGYAVIKGK